MCSCICLLLVKGLNVEVVPSEFAENLHKSSFDSPSDYVKETALQKALHVAQKLKHETVSIVYSFKKRFVYLCVFLWVVLHFVYFSHFLVLIVHLTCKVKCM